MTPFFLFHLVLVSLLGQGQPQQTADAFVLGLSGHWLVDGKPVEKGTKLFYGQTIRLNPHGGHGRIVIFYDGGNMEASCSDQSGCIDLTVKRPAQISSDAYRRVIDTLKGAFDSDSSSVPGLSKSASLGDGYAELRDTTLSIHIPDLPPSFLQNNYLLQFRGIGANNQLDAPIEPAFNWRPESPISTPGVKPGLYRVGLLDSDALPSGNFFYLLVFSSDSPDHIAEDFNALVDATDTWSPEDQSLALRTRRLFLWQSAKSMGFQGAK